MYNGVKYNVGAANLDLMNETLQLKKVKISCGKDIVLQAVLLIY